MNKQQTFDVIIIGGSYAGLSAAMTLGRALRAVLVIDNGNPCNKQTPHSHNFITHDGETPAAIAQKARDQLTIYNTVQFQTGKAVDAVRTSNGFKVTLENGDTFNTRKLLLTTGIRDIPMDIDGFAECWGISVLHCPYCHGYEVRHEALGIIANGDAGFEHARLINNWSTDLTMFTNGPSTLTADQQARLSEHNIIIEEKKIAALKHQSGVLSHLIFEDGSIHPLKALFARSTIVQHSNIAEKLGCELYTEGMQTNLIKVEDSGKTSQPGVYAAGDNSNMRSVAVAVASGNKAGAFINHELIAESF